ncbi:MAG: outer membrane beta-barrel protein [candidate division Zixibacteria bacterium]|nr:outer membrane beta-barrel protein [candidate division Zixibacteria bacterium]
MISRFKITCVLVLFIILGGTINVYSEDLPDNGQIGDSLKEATENLYSQAERLYNEGKIIQALGFWEKVEKISPDYRDVRKKLVEAYKFAGIEIYNQNYQAEAIILWEKAVRLDPKNDEIIGYIRRGHGEINKLGKLTTDSLAVSPEVTSTAPAVDTASKDKLPPPETKLNVSSKSKEPNSRPDQTLSDSLKLIQQNLQELTARVIAMQQDKSKNRPVINGFVKASENNNHNLQRTNFNLDEVELDISHNISPRATVHADIEFTLDSLDNFTADIEQGFISTRFGRADRWRMDLGKFIGPAGLEARDAPRMNLYSRGLVSAYGLPQKVVGIMLSRQFSRYLNWSLWAVNGWDINSDNNKDKTFGTRISIVSLKVVKCNINVISGPEDDDNDSRRRSVFDCDLALQYDKWYLGGEVNFGLETKALENNAQADWFGILLLSYWEMSGRVKLAARFDLFKDHDGLRTGFIQNLKSLSLAPSFRLVDNLRGLIEFRYDFSDRDVFLKAAGGTSDDLITSALELTYSF